MEAIYTSLIFFTFLCLSFIYFINTNKDLKIILFFAFFLKLFLVLLLFFNIALPDSTLDVQGFQYYAKLQSHLGFEEIINSFYSMGLPLVYIKVVAIIYSFFGANIYIIYFINIFLGLFNVVIVYKISYLLFSNKQTAHYTTLVYAFYPSVFLYSILPSREIIISFLILISILFILRWIKYGNILDLFIAFIFAYLNLYFHSALVLLIGVYAIVFLIKYMYLALVKQDYYSYIIIFILIILAYIYLNEIIYYLNNIPYINDLNISDFNEHTRSSLAGRLSFPDSLMYNSLSELISNIPLRIYYFLYTPSINNILQAQDLLGIMDSSMVMVLTITVFLNYKSIINNPSALLIFIILLFLIFIFAHGTGNSGTALRHRAKFLSLFILLGIPSVVNQIKFYIK